MTFFVVTSKPIKSLDFAYRGLFNLASSIFYLQVKDVVRSLLTSFTFKLIWAKDTFRVQDHNELSEPKGFEPCPS